MHGQSSALHQLPLHEHDEPVIYSRCAADGFQCANIQYADLQVKLCRRFSWTKGSHALPGKDASKRSEEEADGLQCFELR